jgi:hypothetical protein
MSSPAGGTPTGMSVDAFLGVGTALVVVTVVFVAMRIIANIQTKRLLIDDSRFHENRNSIRRVLTIRNSRPSHCYTSVGWYLRTCVYIDER